MIEHLKFVDIDEDVDLRELVEKVHESGDTIVLCRGGNSLAILTPPEPKPGHRVPTEEDLAASRATAGSWSDFDAEKFLADNEESRSLPGRPPVEF